MAISSDFAKAAGSLSSRRLPVRGFALAFFLYPAAALPLYAAIQASLNFLAQLKNFLTTPSMVMCATKLPIGQLKLISSPVGNLVFYGHFARSHGLHGPTRHPTAGANRQNDQKRPSCAHGRSANSRYAIKAAKGGHMSRLVRWS